MMKPHCQLRSEGDVAVLSQIMCCLSVLHKNRTFTPETVVCLLCETKNQLWIILNVRKWSYLFILFTLLLIVYLQYNTIILLNIIR